MPVITGTNSDDTLVGGSGNDTLNGRDGDDRLSGGGGPDRLFGQLGDDTLFGDDGDDLLHGGLGADRMLGGRGNDAYVVDNAGDVVVEGVSGAAGGHDSVLASVNWTLAANLEDLRLEGFALRGTGNALANALTGNDRNNLLRGLGGDDSLDGGAGADTLDGGNGRDTVVYGFEWESAGFGLSGRVQAVNVNLASGFVWLPGPGQGRDTLLSIENIRTGAGDDTITGSNGANVMFVGAGANVVDGGGGNDILHGGWFGGVDHVGDVAHTEILRGGGGDDIIYGNGNLWDDGSGGDFFFGGQGADIMDGGSGRDRLVASLQGYSTEVNTMIGGGGADRFEFTDEVTEIGRADPSYLGMRATIVDFSSAEDDKIVIDVDNPQDATFVGRVLNSTDVDPGQYGFFEDPLDDHSVYLKYEIFEFASVLIRMQNITSLAADDVLFV
jgi:Ca2+-binding RTX toxin-like protein